MIPRIAIAVALVVLSISLASAQDSRPAEPKTPRPDSPEATAPKIADGTHEYSWSLEGQQAGRSTLKVSTAGGRTTLGFRWQQSFRGSNFASDSTTVYDTKSGAPIDYKQKLVFGNNKRAADRDVRFEFRETGLLRLDFNQDKEAWADEIATPEGAQLYCAQAFENVIWLASLHHARGGTAVYPLVTVGTKNIAQSNGTLSPVEGKPSTYEFKTSGVEAVIEMGADGMLETYRQGPLEIRRIDQNAKKESPKRGGDNSKSGDAKDSDADSTTSRPDGGSPQR